MRISLAIAGMGLGGAQYVMAWLAGALAGRGHAVQLCTFAPPGQAPFFPVSPSVHMTPLDLTAPSGNPASAVRANLRRIRALRGAVFGFRSDVAVSFIDQMNVLCLLALSRRLPVVVSERITPARHHIGRLWSGLRRLTYPSARALVVQTADVASFFPPRVRRRCAMIPNPVLPPPPPNPAAPPAPRLPSPCVVGLGRLHPQKGFDLLLRAFARCRQAHPAWSLRIFGEGPQRPELEALAAELGLPAAEVFPGPVSDVPGILEQTDVFVLPSRFEGFPNALCQAMAQGVAVVAADCPTGPADIVRPGVDGLLVPPEDADALGQALDQCLGDAARRAALGAEARAILDRFSPERILDQWESLLETVVAGGDLRQRPGDDR